jgi:hypothetical protein
MLREKTFCSPSYVGITRIRFKGSIPCGISQRKLPRQINVVSIISLQIVQSSGDNGGAAKFDIFADMSNYDTGDDDEKRPRCHITALLFVQMWYNHSAHKLTAALRQ